VGAGEGLEGGGGDGSVALKRRLAMSRPAWRIVHTASSVTRSKPSASKRCTSIGTLSVGSAMLAWGQATLRA
jgi:hypothetical protein